MAPDAERDAVMIQASVIIATYNRAERLRACLQALCQQTQRTDDFEVIVVVDGSTDGTREMLESFQAPYALRSIDQRNQGQSVALNNGTAAAAGGICIFTDDDIAVGPTLVSDHLRLHRERDRMVGIGQMTLKLPPGADWYAQNYAHDWCGHYAELNRETRQPNWEDCFGGNMSVDRAAFLHVGGFAADLVRGYDIELAYRLAQEGYSFAYLPTALGDQDERKGLEALARESEKSGAGCVELFRRYPSLLRLIGAFPEQRPLWALSWRILMSLDVSPGNLERARRLLGNRAANHEGYRFIKQYAFWKGVRRAICDQDTWKRLTSGVPVLMYHAFGSAGEAPSRYIMPARRFAMQMSWLKRMGYHVLGLEEFLRYRREHRLPPARSVVITIDDGYMDTRSVAYPILRRLNFPATVFLVTGKIGEVNDWDGQSELARRPLLSWSSMHEMLQGGIQFGAHTRTHPDLTTCS
ncbi:MAG: glycosyltransferase, partial [Acidobacteriota bacterium]